MKIETKAQKAEAAAFVKARIERRKAARGGKSKAEAAATRPAHVAPVLTVLESINKKIEAREAKRRADAAAREGLRKARRLGFGG